MSRRSRQRRAQAKAAALPAPPSGPSAFGLTPFDGANFSPSRGFLPWLSVDSRKEVDVYARTELVRASRFCFNNSPIFQRLFGALSHLAIGSGLFPVPETTDEEWNILSMARYERRAGNKFLCDVHRRRNIWQMQRASLLNMMKDGAQFVAKVRVGDAGKLQMIDAMDVGNAGVVGEDEKIWDGVLVDDDEAPVAYRVLGRNPGDFRDVSASDMFHIYNPQRTLQFRELPWAYTGTNSGRDIIDIIASTKNGVKLESLFGLVVKQNVQKALGGTAPGGARTQGGEQDPSKLPKDPRLEAFTRSGILAYLRPNEDITTIKSDRGGATWQAFIKFLIAEIAWSLGVSPDWLFSCIEGGGPAVNASLEDIAWFIIFLQDLIMEGFCQPDYVWSTAIDLASGRLRKCKDPEWYKCAWTRPARVTANMSKTAASDIALYNAGMLPLDDYAARFGTSGRSITDKLIREELYRKRACALAGIDPNRIRPPLPGSPALLLTGGKEEEDDEKKPGTPPEK